MIIMGILIRMTTYTIISEGGQAMAENIQGYEQARAAARRAANQIGDAVELCGGGKSEWVEPDPVTAVLAIGKGTPSSYYPAEERERNGATDYDVTITIGERVIEGSIILYRDKINGGMSSCGTPMEGWCSDTIVKLAYTLTDRSRRDLLGSLECRSAGEIEIELASGDGAQ